MKSKPVKKSAKKAEKPLAEREASDTDFVVPPVDEVPEAKIDVSEGNSLVDQIDPQEKHQPAVKRDVGPVHRVRPAGPTLPPLGHKQKYFESPDGRIYAGPADAPSIPDPLNAGAEINPMRGASQKH